MTIVPVVHIDSRTKTNTSAYNRTNNCSYDKECKMSTRVCIVHRIIIAIAIQVQTIDGFGGEVGGIIGRDKSAPFGRVIPGVAVIEAGIVIVVVATATNMVSFANAISAFLFYQLPHPQSRKTILPGGRLVSIDYSQAVIAASRPRMMSSRAMLGLPCSGI